jgi:hypothetical protein
MGFSVVIVVSDADPFHLSAGSPSTGRGSVSEKGAIAPKAELAETIERPPRPAATRV